VFAGCNEVCVLAEQGKSASKKKDVTEIVDESECAEASEHFLRKPRPGSCNEVQRIFPFSFAGRHRQTESIVFSTERRVE
jgi:hypothetical protein